LFSRLGYVDQVVSPAIFINSLGVEQQEINLIYYKPKNSLIGCNKKTPN
jgi:hypothetical protein